MPANACNCTTMRSHCPNAQARSHREIQDVRKLPVRLVAALAVVDQLCAGRLRRASSPTLLPSEYFIYGALGGFPIFVVGCIAAWRQLRAPSAAKVQTMLDQAPGDAVGQVLAGPHPRLGGPGLWGERPIERAVDLRLTQTARPLWSAPNAGKPPRTAWNHCARLYSAMQAENAQGGIYVAGKAP